jgi:hypothetical protein
MDASSLTAYASPDAEQVDGRCVRDDGVRDSGKPTGGPSNFGYDASVAEYDESVVRRDDPRPAGTARDSVDGRTVHCRKLRSAPPEL